MKKLLLLLLLLPLAASAQTGLVFEEKFNDGDFTQNPTWTGDAAFFQVNSIGGNFQLQSNGPTTGTQARLVTATTAGAAGTTWEFWANFKQNTSSANFADIWLISEQADLKATSNRGYFVRLGGQDDKVELYRKDASTTLVTIVPGVLGSFGTTTNNLVRVRVTRSVQNVWTLERDFAGGTNYTSQGTGTDATYQGGAYFGVAVAYSSTTARGYFFDDFKVTDTAAPQLVQAGVSAANQVDVTFSEPVSNTQSSANYRLTAASAPVVTGAVRDATNHALVHLTFSGNIPLGVNTLEVTNISDLYTNVATAAQTVNFTNNGIATAPRLNQVLITEIFADETPQVALPLSEYIEIHNPSATAVIDLAGVQLLKPGSTSAAVFPAGSVLLPGEYAVVCGSTRGTQFGVYGKVFPLTNFPALSNGGDQLVLRGRDKKTLFEIAYSDTWYKDARKKDGGWSLEMVDTTNPCAGIDNWTASTDASGGTPARANSVRATNPDRTAPALLRALALDATTVRLSFGEKLDSASVVNPALYSLSPAVAISRVVPIGPDFRQVELKLAAPLQPNQPITVTVQRAQDCVGNATGAAVSATFALPSPAVAGDVVINEILFNPRTNAVDFVELLNRSAKYVDVQGWQLGNQRPDGSVDAEIVTATPYVLGPGQLVVLTTRPDIVQSQYPTSSDPAAFLAMPDLPTFPDDAGVVVVYDAQGRTLDRFAYTDDMHLKLLDDDNGVSLERIRANGPSTPDNFHSAASAVGYATPGRPNSQYQDDIAGDKLFKVEPEIFTPDEDGQQDFTTLNYTLDAPGYAASVTVYDAQGRLTRRLVRNETLPTTGFFQWNGLNDRGQKAAVGYYVLMIELFKPNSGEKRQYKQTVVLGARF